MSLDNTKREALIAEGLTEGEADYLLSGGTKTDGLELPASLDDATPPAPATAPSSTAREQPHDANLAASDNELREWREKATRLDERMRVFREAMEQPTPRLRRQRSQGKNLIGKATPLHLCNGRMNDLRSSKAGLIRLRRKAMSATPQ